MPRSKADNAYDLLNDTCKAILEEPRRYNQERWGAIRRWHSRTKIELGVLPACGTTACIAGWMSILRGLPIGPHDSEYQASTLLGDIDHGDLFSGNLFGVLLPTPRIGTRAYARLGVKHIRQFMVDYKEALKARKLPPFGELYLQEE